MNRNLILDAHKELAKLYESAGGTSAPLSTSGKRLFG